nr:amidohydrolase family protein [uncultured Pseudodesulfovibrio sp.]
MSFTRREFLFSLIGLGATPAFPTLADAMSKGKTAIAARIFTGEGSLPLNDHAVLIHQGLIENIVPVDAIRDRPVLHFADSTILPGIINAHCHRIHAPGDRRKRWLKRGVTAVGDVGSPMEAMPLLAESPPSTTATARFTGPMLTPPGGYPLPVHDHKYALIVNSPPEAREAVTMLAGQGATMIKISFEPGPLPEPWPVFDARTAATICNTARKLGLTVRCHVEDFSGLEPALNAGVHSIEHVPHRWHTHGQIRSILTEDKQPIAQYISLLERMKQEDIVLTPTLDVLSRSPWQGAALFEPVRTFHAMGGRIAVGNDYPYRRTDAGMSSREMRLLCKAGMSPLDVMRAATQGSAAACGFTDRGRLLPGMVADMIVTQGNPALSLECLNSPLQVIKDGEFIE